jgi:Protein of unknown function (DUF2721)
VALPTADLSALPVIAHAIQLAVAPVFLLTGVAALLGVMATRLARIIDRARYFEATWHQLSDDNRRAAGIELASLDQRRVVASWAINFCTVSALLVCLVVTTLFVDAFFATDLKWLAGLLFIGSMLALIAGLTCFLREVTVATRTVRVLTLRPRD